MRRLCNETGWSTDAVQAPPERSLTLDRYVHNIIFHEIVDDEQEQSSLAGRYWMRRERFEAVLDILAGRDDIVLTFDDGFRSDVSAALPALRSRGLTAKFFITAAHLGQPGYLRSTDVKMLADHGMTVGTHGWRHVSWRRLHRDQLVGEITQSRAVLEDLINAKVKELSIPSGQYNRRVLDVIRDLGFDRVYTVDGPWACHDRWLQPRFAVTHADTPETIQATVALSRHGLGAAVRAGKRWIKQNRWQ